jgi:hypothetical protein
MGNTSRWATPTMDNTHDGQHLTMGNTQRWATLMMGNSDPSLLLCICHMHIIWQIFPNSTLGSPYRHQYFDARLKGNFPLLSI